MIIDTVLHGKFCEFCGEQASYYVGDLQTPVCSNPNCQESVLLDEEHDEAINTELVNRELYGHDK